MTSSGGWRCASAGGFGSDFSGGPLETPGLSQNVGTGFQERTQFLGPRPLGTELEHEAPSDRHGKPLLGAVRDLALGHGEDRLNVLCLGDLFQRCRIGFAQFR